MSENEASIREVVDTWMKASRSGDSATVLSLMTEDAVFMMPGREPFGREVFETAADGGPAMEGTSEIVELKVLGDWAFTRNRLALSVTPQSGEPIRRGGYTLTLYRKEPDGCWRLAGDANHLTVRS